MRKLMPRVVSPTVVEQIPFRDERQGVELSIITPAGGKTGRKAVADQNPVIIWNGLLGSRKLHAQLAHLLAYQLRRPIVTYDDPEDCYDIGRKAERAAAATRAVTTDRPATVLAYSQAALKFSLIGRELIRGQRVDTLGLLAPAGVVPHPVVPNIYAEVDWRIQSRTTKLMLEEFATIPRMIGSIIGARAALGLPASGLRYGLRWSSLVREVHTTFKTDATQEYAELSDTIHTGAVGFANDRYFPGKDVVECLHGQGFSGHTGVYDGNHMTPVFHTPTVAKVGAFVQRLNPMAGPVGT